MELPNLFSIILDWMIPVTPGQKSIGNVIQICRLSLGG